MQSLGLREQPTHLADEVWLWPCNVADWGRWCEIQTQWRVGFAGLTGLDYTACLAHLRLVHGLRGAELRETWECLRAAERAHLEALAERREMTP